MTCSECVLRTVSTPEKALLISIVVASLIAGLVAHFTGDPKRD